MLWELLCLLHVCCSVFFAAFMLPEITWKRCIAWLLPTRVVIDLNDCLERKDDRETTLCYPHVRPPALFCLSKWQKDMYRGTATKKILCLLWSYWPQTHIKKKPFKIHETFNLILLTKSAHILPKIPKAAPNPLTDQMPLTKCGAALWPLNYHGSVEDPYK